MLDEFFAEIDQQWQPRATAPITLRVIGSTALMLQTDYIRGTKDSDIVRTAALTEEISQRLLGLAGKDTKLFERHRMYLELVHDGILFRRQQVDWIEVSGLNDRLQSFRIAK